MTSRTPIALASHSRATGKIAPSSMPIPSRNQTIGVALEQLVAADQVEDQGHEGDRQDRTDDARLGVSRTTGSVSAAMAQITAPPASVGAGRSAARSGS